VAVVAPVWVGAARVVAEKAGEVRVQEKAVAALAEGAVGSPAVFLVAAGATAAARAVRAARAARCARSAP
jgi:hypothetical protein